MKPLQIRAVLFDFDGTLSRPGSLDFARIKSELGCPPGEPVLEFIQGLPDEEERRRCLSSLEAFERAGAEGSRANRGAEETVRRLKRRDVRVGLITRNSLASVQRALQNFDHLTTSHFDVVITRDDPVTPKPDPQGILLAAEALGVDPADMAVVGDFVFDVEAGRRAGAVTVFLTNDREAEPPEADFVIRTLPDLEKALRMGLPLPAGKLPGDLLTRILEELHIEDASVLVGPGTGEDTAVLDTGGAELLVVTSDPITFATDSAGFYAVAVNANDLATSGALPRWLVTTLLLPLGTPPSRAYRLMEELASECRRLGISPCGGHTEITPAVTQPVIAGTMLGTLSRGSLVDKQRMRPGDALLMTKSAGLEGTAIAAREHPDRLRRGGIPDETLERCAGLLSRISVLEEAGAAAAFEGTSAMHDVTEGGVATALVELSEAGGYGLRVDLDAIPILEETREVCRVLGLDPLGLIGSGSLLICCRPEQAGDLARAVQALNVPIRPIGEVLDRGPGVEAVGADGPSELPSFEADEITRL
jgi:HAD superfamily hydrolase (TIGR01509 family)